MQVFVFALQAFLPLRRCPFLMWGLLRKPRTLGLPLLPSLPSEGWDEGGGLSWDALVLLPEGLPLLPLDFRPAGGAEEPLVARLVRTSSLLSPRFIRRLRVQKLRFCRGIMLPALSQLALHHLCMLYEVMGWEGLRRLAVLGCLSLLISACPVR